MENFDVNEAEELLKSGLQLTDETSEEAKFMGKLALSESKVQTVVTKDFKGTRTSFNEETAKRVNSLVERVEKLSIAASHVANKIRFTKATQRSRRQAPLLINNLIVDGPIKVQRINGRSVGDLVYKSNRKNKNLKDIVAKEILFSKQLFVTGKVDGVEVTEDNLFMNKNQILRPFRINNLTAKSINNVVTVNTLTFPEFFTLLRRSTDKSVPNSITQFNVDSLQINRLVNGRNFTVILENHLKTSGEQVLTAPKNIGKLTANRVVYQKVLRDQTVSGVPIALLVDINDKNQRIDIKQDVRFTQDLDVNRLQVLQRINNIKARDGQLQIMRKRGLDSQVVTAEKSFDNVHLESPIVLQGKIESKSLERMNPISTIDENLVLQGDYKITGPVRIRKVLKATDNIRTNNEKLNFRNLLDNGFNLNSTTSTNSKLVFENVVQVQGNLQTVSLNQKSVANFVRADTPELQDVRGATTFKNGLTVVGGTVQVDVVNDVDMNHLNRTILKRSSSVTQFIDGTVEMASLKTDKLVSSNVVMNNKNIGLVLNSEKVQNVDEIIAKHVHVKNLKIKNLHQRDGRKIFGADLNFILNDVVTQESVSDGSLIADKEFTNLKVEHLMFTKDNEWKTILTNFENTISQDLNISGDAMFGSQMRIENLHFTGTINGISHSDMTNNWLRVEGDQVFTADQNFKSLSIGNNLGLASGFINDVNITKMFDESIWIDEPISLEDLVIDGQAVVKGKTLAPTVNGMTIEGKLLLNNTDEVQTIKSIEVASHADIEYLNFTKLNQIDLDLLTKTMKGEVEDLEMIVKGKVRLDGPANITWLNGENVEELHNKIWLADEDVVLTGDDIQFNAGVKSDGGFYTDVRNT